MRLLLVRRRGVEDGGGEVSTGVYDSRVFLYSVIVKIVSLFFRLYVSCPIASLINLYISNSYMQGLLL
jgi:hypothetical protein